MKKSILSLGLLLSLFAVSFGQLNWPECSDLTVTSIEMDDDTSNLMKVTIYNNCDTCNSWNSGPVYLEMRIIRTIAPFDTIAASNCHCLWTPQNKSSYTYSINSIQDSIPSAGTFRVDLEGLSPGCDSSIAINLSVGMEELTTQKLLIYPNPAKHKVHLQTHLPVEEILIRNIFGAVVLQKKDTEKITSIDLRELNSGIYFLTITSSEAGIISDKIIKE